MKLARRGEGWRLGAMRVTDGTPVWLRALGLPWRQVILRIVGDELRVEENPPPMPLWEDGTPLHRVDPPPAPYPPPEDAEWSWEPPDDEAL